jgi:hypothetical protein
MYIPRNFVSVLYGISLPSKVTSGNTDFLFFVIWKETANVFSTLTTRLFSVYYVCNSFITLFNLSWRLFIFSSDTNMFVSSANYTIFDPIIFRVGHLCIMKIVLNQESNPMAHLGQFPFSPVPFKDLQLDYYHPGACLYHRYSTLF